MIVTKDSDFEELAVLRGAPPKVVWVRFGNCSTHDVELALRQHAALVRAFADDDASSMLTIDRALRAG